ncbi:uncharacterized protein LTR77_001319 [Saxophila tyrrhenica]|uniref:Uncharacterized protein n=1 Tax=Saxophila tyrrhenica TaxID=1690608 RepID=A0AAV9PL65_9PEZI|nr:hypothetical protein LTR77_001319 [Saxophila tyrrhenica]
MPAFYARRVATSIQKNESIRRAELRQQAHDEPIKAHALMQREIHLRVAKLPAELRSNIYDQLVYGAFVTKQQGVTYLSLDYTTGKVTESEVDPAFYIFAPGALSSRNFDMFKQPLSETSELFHEYFATVSKVFVWSFTSASSLRCFTSWLRPYLRKRPNPPAVRVAIFAFDDSSSMVKRSYGHQGYFSHLAFWYPMESPHGCLVRAESHFQEWTDAMQLVPDIVDMEYVACYPWGDYESLRKLSAPLCGRGNLRVAVEKKGWKDVTSYRELHLALTIAAVAGSTIPRPSDFHELDLRVPYGYGCRGIESSFSN